MNKIAAPAIFLALFLIIGLYFVASKQKSTFWQSSGGSHLIKMSSSPTREYVAFSAIRLLELRSIVADPRVTVDFQECRKDTGRLVNSSAYQNITNGVQFPYARDPNNPKERLNYDLEIALNRLFSVAFVYRITGEQEYLSIARNFVVSFVKLYPSDHQAIDLSHIINSISISWDLIKDELTQEDNEIIRAYLLSAMISEEQRLDQEPFAFGTQQRPPYRRDSSWTTHFVGSFGTCAAVLELDQAPGFQPRWITKSSEAIQDYLNQGWHENGISAQGVHYTSYGFHYASWFMAYMERKGQKFLTHDKIKNFANWIVYDMYPWGKYDVNSWYNTEPLAMGFGEAIYSISYHNQDNPNSGYAIDEYRKNSNQNTYATPARIIWRWFPNSSTAAERNLPLYLFDKDGFLFARSSWQEDAMHILFRAHYGQWHPGHGHADTNTFTLAKDGKVIGTDPGFGWKHTVDHSGILINNIGQGWYRYPGIVKDFLASGNKISITGDATLAYKYRTGSQHDYNNNGYTYSTEYPDEKIISKLHNPVIRALRHITFTTGPRPYVVIEDDIDKNGQINTYTWQLITPFRGSVVDSVGSNYIVLKDVFAGDYAQTISGNDSTVQASFLENRYKLFVMVSKENWEPWSWNLKLDILGATYEVTVPYADESEFDWIEVPTNGLFLSGLVSIKVRPVGDIKIGSIAFVPENKSAVDDEAIIISATQLLEGNSKWIAASTGPARKTLIYFMNSNIVSISYNQHKLADNSASYLPEYNTVTPILKSVKAIIQSVNGNFRAFIYPHKEGDIIPLINFNDTFGTIKWPTSDDTYVWRLKSQLDNQPPKVTITKPLHNSVVAGRKMNINVVSQDNIKVSKLVVSIDEIARATYVNPSSETTFQWQISSWNSSTKHTIKAEAFDSSGNSSVHSINIVKK